MEKQKLFSVTKKDFDIQFFRAGGKGGQNQNKVSSACRVVHPPSGAVGECREYRDQPQNKKQAFLRCVNSAKFENWLRIEIARQTGQTAELERQVEDWMKPENLRVEYIEG